MNETRTKVGLLHRAFFNQYNMILLGTSGLFAATTQSWLPVIVGAGTEILWLVLGTDSAFFKRWAATREREEEEALQKSRLEYAKRSLDPWYLERFSRLEQTSAEINELTKENERLKETLLESEMQKLEKAVQSYLQMAVVHQRLGGFFHDTQRPSIEADIARCERELAGQSNSRLRSSLGQALELAQRRLAQHDELQASYQSLGVEMDTLEKSFAFLKSQVLNLSSREELSAELDNLVSGVTTVEDLDRETEKLLQDLRGARVASTRRNAARA